MSLYVEMLDDQGGVSETVEAREEMAECDTDADGHQDSLRLCVLWTSASRVQYSMCRECESEEGYVRVVRS
jgi:hypothetical protein